LPLKAIFVYTAVSFL